MKIKKFLLGLAVCLAIVPLAVGFSACGKNNNNYDLVQKTGKFTSQYIEIR